MCLITCNNAIMKLRHSFVWYVNNVIKLISSPSPLMKSNEVLARKLSWLTRNNLLIIHPLSFPGPGRGRLEECEWLWPRNHAIDGAGVCIHPSFLATIPSHTAHSAHTTSTPRSAETAVGGAMRLLLNIKYMMALNTRKNMLPICHLALNCGLSVTKRQDL